MSRTIQSMKEKYLQPSLDMVRRTFTDHENAEEAQVVVNLIEEIRSMKTCIPELELIMTDENDEVIGYAMFSRFHLGGKFMDELLLLSPVAVKVECQRQHISKELIEYGFEKAKKMGFTAVIVEGNPQNYGVAFGKHSALCNDIGLCLFRQRDSSLQRTAGADHVIQHNHSLALHLRRVVLAEIELLQAMCGDGLIVYAECIAHVDLQTLAGDDVLLAALT